MKKTKTHLFILSVLFTANLFSQSIPNSGFEDWTNFGSYENPENWITANGFEAFGIPENTFKTTDANSGVYAARLETIVGATGDTFPGLLLTGTGDLFNSDVLIGIDQKPTRFLFYYKGGPQANDTSGVELFLTKWDNVNNVRIPMGGVKCKISTFQNSYTLVDTPIEYTESGTPDSMYIIALSSNTVTIIPGSTLYLDDISFQMSGVGIYETEIYSSSVYPNPVKNELSFKIEGTTVDAIEVLDLSGRLVFYEECEFSDKSIDVSSLNTGTYLYNLKYKNVTVSNGKFNVSK